MQNKNSTSQIETNNDANFLTPWEENQKARRTQLPPAVAGYEWIHPTWPLKRSPSFHSILTKLETLYFSFLFSFCFACPHHRCEGPTDCTAFLTGGSCQQ